MRVAVKILPKKEVLDPQGRAVEEVLKHQGRAVENCRVGRYVELEISAPDRDQALEKAHNIAREVLSNPLIESFSIDFLSDEEKAS